MKTKLLALLLSLTYFFTAHTAQAQFVNYEDDHGWNLGFNMGGVWQQKEGSAVPFAGLGGGLTFGKSLYEKKGAFFSFDLRFRYLRGRSYGWETTPSTVVVNSLAIDGYKNYKLDLNEYTLEGVLTLNKLREQTGILLYGFGGAGLTDYNVTSNYADNSKGGNAYDYSLIDPATQSSSAIANDLKDNYNDKDYETSTKDQATEFMPSLGLGLGYQITPHFSMGVEHKITFPLHDNIDGISNGVNDRYHYTGVVLSWNLFGRGDRQVYTVPQTTTPTDVTTYTDTPKPNPIPSGSKPLVNIVNPTTNNQEVSSSAFTIKANVYYVEDNNHIVFRQNGIELDNFSFNPSTNKFVSNVTLQPGNNVFQIIGNNNYGSDQDSKIIIYKRINDELLPPIVTITNPLVCPHTTNEALFPLTSTVLNVENKSQISLIVNEAPITNFSYNVSTKVLSAYLTLKPGVNNILITATNAKGNDRKTCQITYQAISVKPPVVSFTTPSNNPHKLETSSAAITGKVLNVATASDIKVLVNGNKHKDFTYNTATKVIAFNANLLPGNNIIEVTGTNSVGSDSKSKTIIYKIPEVLPKPVVTYIVPATSPYNVSVDNIEIKATVLNVASRQNIRVTHNNNQTTNFDFNFLNKVVSFNANLVEGANTFVVRGSNPQGIDEKTTVVVYKKPARALPPVISITNPATDPFATQNNTKNIEATILNVISSQNVTATFNGQATSNFTFNTLTKKFAFNANLIEGANVLQISAVNNVGSASKTQTVIYTKPICNKPVIKVQSPRTSPVNTTNSKGSINATISGATSVQFQINGVLSPGFNYDENTGKFSSLLNLSEGVTVYNIIAKNPCGETVKSITYIYEQDLPCFGPVITFTKPVQSPSTHTGRGANSTFSANLINVATKDMVVVKHNNAPVNFTFNSSNGGVSGSVMLKKGSNTITIVATNKCESITKEVVIEYAGIQNITVDPVAPKCKVPTISVTSSNTTSATLYALTADVANVINPSNVSVSLNGSNVPSAYNPLNDKLTAQITLQEGTNNIVINANECDGATKTYTVVYTVPCDPVSYNFILPNGNSATSAAATYMIKVNTANVESQDNITVKLNGVNTPFTFNSNSGMINASDIPLQYGVNTIVVTIGNACSNETITYNVTYEKVAVAPPCEVPTISVTSANSASAAAYTLKADLANVTGPSNVSVTLNGNNVTSAFNAMNGRLTVQTFLQEGNNTFVITANECDGATQTFNVMYTVPCDPVSYNFILPNGNSATSAAATYMIKVNTANVPSKDNITVKVNRGDVPFTFNSNSGMINASDIPLQNGSNTIVVTIANECSNENIVYTVTYEEEVVAPPCETPTIHITSSKGAQLATYSFKADVTNVTDPSNITLTVNGTNTPVVFNPASRKLTAQLTLKEGPNDLVVTANECDGATENFTVVYSVPCDPVSYNFILPNGHSSTSAAATYTIKVNTANVPAQSNISAKLNGNRIAFTFNPNSGMINAKDIVLVNGENNVVITIANECSSETINYTITYQAPTQGNGNGGSNNGHGNNEDGVDSSNPGQGNGGPNGQEDPSGDDDDENGKGNGNGNKANTDAVNQQYATAIKKGDMYFNVKKWTTARTFYQQASGLKPNEAYPKSQLNIIKAKLKSSVPVKTNTTKPTKPVKTTKPTNTTKPTSTKPKTNTIKTNSSGNTKTPTKTNVKTPVKTNTSIKPKTNTSSDSSKTKTTRSGSSGKTNVTKPTSKPVVKPTAKPTTSGSRTGGR